MAGKRSVGAKLKSWFKRDEPRKGPGPGGGPNSESYNRARAEGEFIHIRDSGAGWGS